MNHWQVAVNTAVGRVKKNLWAWKISSPACLARLFGGWKIIFRGGINTDDVLIYVHSLCAKNYRTGTDTINSQEVKLA